MCHTAATQITISVVTPSYNQGEFLAATIESVLSQAGDFHIDYIVMDGGSSDDSVAILEGYRGVLARGEWPLACAGVTLRFASARDGGQADAVSKGFALAEGEILGWLNSDDTYLPGALARAVAFFAQHPDHVMVYGNAWYTDRGGAVTGSYPSEPFSLKRLASRCIICQPAAFLRRCALRETGALDATLHTCLDYDLWIRIGKRFGERIAYIDDYLATSRMYPDNKTLSLRDHIHRETMEVAKKHFGYVPGSWIAHSILETVQTPGISVTAKMRLILGKRRFVFRYLAQPATLASLVLFLASRIARRPPHG